MGERETLIHYLDAQRESVLAILDGLDETALRTPVLPSGWTPLGLLAHLCEAERFWGQIVLVAELDGPKPWPSGEQGAAFAVDLPTDVVVDFYREQGRITNRNLAAADLDGLPAQPPPDMAELATDVRTLALHVIEETARHAGHLDVARELIDGRVGLGPR